jgi:cation diffusion facilitator CzcD-associated flavoprotein CzcO
MPGTAAESPASTAEASVAILGAGLGGICMALKLLEAGRRDFIIFERASDLGGTWRDNTYPGCSCDIPSHLYSLSFAQHAGWTRRFASQNEIIAYIRDVAHRYGVYRHVLFNTCITAMHWNDSNGSWRLVTGNGRHFTTQAVVAAVGGLHTPAFPRIDGLGDFTGPLMHSARWQHDVELSGRNVAVIGTGASSTQIVPEIAPRVGSLHLYQRTPPWVLPRNDRPYSRFERWAYAQVPGLLALSRASHYWRAESRAVGLTMRPRYLKRSQKRVYQFLRRTVTDAGMRHNLWPDYTLGCKRVILSDTFYTALNLPHVDLVTTPIDRILPDAIVAQDGTVRPTDVIICATGFRAFDLAASIEIRGRRARLLSDDWRDGPRAFRGVAVAGYPNFFMIMGPNSGLGHNSILFMIESQSAYIRQCLDWLRRGLVDRVEVREDVQREYNAAIDRRFEQTVWRGPEFDTQKACTSWYLHESGRNTAIWPSFSATYWLLMRRAERRHFLQGAPHKLSDTPCGAPRHTGPFVGTAGRRIAGPSPGNADEPSKIERVGDGRLARPIEPPQKFPG